MREILTASSRKSADACHAEGGDPPLTLTNWPYWSRYWQSLLYIHDFWKYVDPNNIDGPDNPPTVDDTNSSDSPNGSNHQHELGKYLEKQFTELHLRFLQGFSNTGWLTISHVDSFRQHWIQIQEFCNQIPMQPETPVTESDGSTNWPRWSFDWKHILHIYEIWNFVDPDRSDEPTGSFLDCDPNEVYSTKKYIELHSRMLSSMDGNCVMAIEPNSSMRQKWIKLRDFCHDGTEQAKVELLSTLLNTVWKRGDSPSTFATRFLTAYTAFNTTAPGSIDTTTAASILMLRIPCDSKNWGDGLTTWEMIKPRISKDCTTVFKLVRWITLNCPVRPRDWPDNTAGHALFARPRKGNRNPRRNNGFGSSRSRWRPYCNKNGRQTRNSLSRR